MISDAQNVQLCVSGAIHLVKSKFPNRNHSTIRTQHRSKLNPVKVAHDAVVLYSKLKNNWPKVTRLTSEFHLIRLSCRFYLYRPTGSVWHKSCFNCAECHRPLDSTLACDGPDREIHCRACYAKLFGPKGFGYGHSPTLVSTSGESTIA